MNQGKTVFAQLLQFVPFSHFEHLVDVYQANKGVTAFSAWSHFICLAYAQLTRLMGKRRFTKAKFQFEQSFVGSFPNEACSQKYNVSFER